MWPICPCSRICIVLEGATHCKLLYVGARKVWQELSGHGMSREGVAEVGVAGAGRCGMNLMGVAGARRVWQEGLKAPFLPYIFSGDVGAVMLTVMKTVTTTARMRSAMEMTVLKMTKALKQVVLANVISVATRDLLRSGP